MKASTSVSDLIKITDVTLRDGLQAETKHIPWSEKKTLFLKLQKLGYARLEVASFANPKWVPQFIDNEAFCTDLYRNPTGLPETMAFVPNLKGCERLVAFPIPWVSGFVAASETFNQKNVNASISETLVELSKVKRLAQKENRKVRIYVSTAFGCPYEGAIEFKKLQTLLKQVVDLGPDEIALSDTIGVAAPPQVHSILKELKMTFPIEQIGLHLHNTYGLALANIQAGYEEGVRIFDGATGGIGGCPYAKGATGNVATEEILYLFKRQLSGLSYPEESLRDVLQYLKTNLGLSVHSSINDIFTKGGTLYASQ